MFRIRFADGKYENKSQERTRAGKVWPTEAIFRSHISYMTAYFMREANSDRDVTKWTVFPSQIKYFQDFYGTAVVVNESTKVEVPALEYMDDYYRNHYLKSRRKKKSC